MVRDGFVQEGPAWMGSNKRVDALCGMSDCPGDELVRALGMMAIPFKKAPRGLRVRMRPVAEFARGLGVMFGPAFERHRPGGRAGVGRRWRVHWRRRWWWIPTGRATKPEGRECAKTDER